MPLKWYYKLCYKLNHPFKKEDEYGLVTCRFCRSLLYRKQHQKENNHEATR